MDLLDPAGEDPKDAQRTPQRSWRTLVKELAKESHEGIPQKDHTTGPPLQDRVKDPAIRPDERPLSRTLSNTPHRPPLPAE